MEFPPIHQNIKANLRPFLIILLSIFIFISFTLRNAENLTKSIEPKLEPLVVGLYKSGEDEEEYFKDFKPQLEKVLNEYPNRKWKVEVKSFSSLDMLCEAIKDGKVHIAGEFTPIEYVVRREKCKFQPFLGIEYNGQAYYHSVLFVPRKDENFPSGFSQEEGIDNQGTIFSMLNARREARLALLEQKDSTSGYYYPHAYLIREGLPFHEAKGFQTSEKIYKTVLKNGKKNRFIGGFLADFRLKNYERKVVNEKDENGKPQYAKPLIIAKSDPIPNGVFVMSREKINQENSADIKRLIRIWKTLKPKVGSGIEITGWREGLERDLELVEYHKDQVDYHELLQGRYEFFLVVFIAIWVLIISFVSYRFLSRI